MRTFFSFIFILSLVTANAQSPWATSFNVNTTPEIGMAKIYAVTDFQKVDNLFYGYRSEVKSTVTFIVLDTMAGGYWIRYRAESGSIDEKNDSSAYYLSLLTDGLELNLYLKNGRMLLDSVSYFRCKNRIAAMVDSIMAHETFHGKLFYFMNELQATLKEDAGLGGSFLGPLELFITWYSSGSYSKFRFAANGYKEDILHKYLFRGMITQQWKGSSKSGGIELNHVFTADPVEGAKYLRGQFETALGRNNIHLKKNDYPPEVRLVNDYNYYIQSGSFFPYRITSKSVSEYLFRSVGKIEMKEMFE